jgi:RNA polymerase primary sigma factor
MTINNEKFNEISKYCESIKDSKALTREEERELAELIKKGDNTALNKLVTSNLKYVVRIAKRYVWTNIPIYDLISEGNLGLITAAKNFNPSFGTKFITYADRWIRQSIAEYVKNYNLDTEFTGADDYVFDNEVDVDLIDDEFEERVHSIQSREDAVNELMTCLSKRENEVLTAYFGLNGKEQQTLEEIGKTMSLTQERVRQIKDKGIEKLQYKAVSSNKYSEFKDLY